MLDSEVVRKENVLNEMANVAYYPVFRDELLLEKSTRISVSEIAMLGVAAFTPVLDVIQQITENTLTTVADMPLFTVDMRGYSGDLAALHDGSGYLSSVIGEHGGVIGQAAFVPVDTDTVAAVTHSTVALNPALILGAAMMLSINHKLDMIQQDSKNLAEYFKNKDKARLRAHLETLIEIQNMYKSNIDNERYKTLKGSAVEKIKIDAESSIIEYRNQIKNILNEKKAPHGNKNVKEKLSEIEEILAECQLAVYVYSFSAFLGALFLENFKTDFLQSTIQKIERYSLQYRELYEECYNYMELYMDSSMHVQMLKGAANVNKFAGETLGKIPILNKGSVDELLIGASDKLRNIKKQKKQDILQDLVNKQSSYIRPFVDNIKKMDEIYNEPKVIMLDRENIYLVEQAALA